MADGQSAAQQVCACGRPIRDTAWLCHGCTARLHRDLAEVQALVDEVETSRLRQSKTGGQAIGGGHSSDRPLPFDERPAERARELREVLRTWSAFVVAGGKGRSPVDASPYMARFLLTHLGWLRCQEEAPAAREQIGGVVGGLRRVVDRPADLTYAGICSALTPLLIEDVLTVGQCPTHLYVPFGRKSVRCPECQAVHNMAERREVLLAALEDQLAHAALLSKGLSNLGRPVSDATIRSWVFRKRLVAHSADDLGRALYRVGDVLDLMKAEAVRQAELAAKRAAEAEKVAKRRAC